MNPFRSLLDGLHPLLRFLVQSTVSIVLAVLILLLLRTPIAVALGIAVAITAIAQTAAAYQLRTWPWREPAPRDDH